MAEDPKQDYTFRQCKNHKKPKHGSRHDDVGSERAKVRVIVGRQFLRVPAVARASLRILRRGGQVVLIIFHGSHLLGVGLIIIRQENGGA